ncbi:MAG: hypothetical protein DRP70_08125 [Spirochaetes bacterium]|nr:MAG: hypothetical protein DRP70_08125 [Spirochaetota bacterium]
MKKTTILMLLVVLLAMPLLAEGNSLNKDKEIKTLQISQDGRAKIGLLMGMPSGVTFGYRFSNWFEGNVTAGYNFAFAQSAIISVNGLFTLVNIPIGDAGVMPLSLGPQINFILGNNFYMDAVADLRLEYSFPEIPLNLFGEFGFGVRFFKENDWIAWNGGVGVRYIF